MKIMPRNRGVRLIRTSGMRRVKIFHLFPAQSVAPLDTEVTRGISLTSRTGIQIQSQVCYAALRVLMQGL